MYSAVGIQNVRASHLEHTLDACSSYMYCDHMRAGWWLKGGHTCCTVAG